MNSKGEVKISRQARRDKFLEELRTNSPERFKILEQLSKAEMDKIIDELLAVRSGLSYLARLKIHEYLSPTPKMELLADYMERKQRSYKTAIEKFYSMRERFEMYFHPEDIDMCGYMLRHALIEPKDVGYFLVYLSAGSHWRGSSFDPWVLYDEQNFNFV